VPVQPREELTNTLWPGASQVLSLPENVTSANEVIKEAEGLDAYPKPRVKAVTFQQRSEW